MTIASLPDEVQNIRHLLQKRGVTSSRLADMLGLNPRDVRRRLNGVTRFSIQEIRDIAEHFGIAPGPLAFVPPEVFRGR